MPATLKRDSALADSGLVPAAICARWGHFARSTISRAVDSGTLTGQRVSRRLYVEWRSFRVWVGPLAEHLPPTAHAAIERAP